MEDQNSLLFYQEIYTHLHSDVAGAYASVRRVEYARDLAVMRDRVSFEGMGFFTKTLPRLGKAVDKALSLGGSLQFSSFSKKKGTELPAFCWWLFSEVFDEAGRERSDACPQALKRLRQLLLVSYKLEVPYAAETIEKVISNFVSTDAALAFNPERLPVEAEIMARRARTLVRRVMSGLCPRDIVPRHGPGVVATGERPWQKRFFKRIYKSAEVVYPFTEYYYYNASHLCDRVHKLDALITLDAGTAKVVLVPKDSRGPRLISCEPLELQWFQQGQFRAIVPWIESHPLTRGHVNFTDQMVNRELALSASLTGDLATLDMKDASDRVSWELVNYLFPEDWGNALYATRSVATVLPDGTEIQLRKFAPMGSAVCFPVEALIFWALCVSIVQSTRHVSLVEARSAIYVYGDDIICSSVDHAAIRQYLPLFDLAVNEAKCCTGRNYKESCGCDAYKGVDVTPTKFRRVWSQQISADSLPSWVEYSNSLWAKGYYACAEYIECAIQKIKHVPYFNEEQHDGVGFVREHVDTVAINRALGFKYRFNKDLQCRQMLGFRVKTREETHSFRCNWEDLLLTQSGKDVHSENCSSFRLHPAAHVEYQRYALRRRKSLQRCWITTN